MAQLSGPDRGLLLLLTEAVDENTAPSNPVVSPVIMGAATGAPETIPALIGIKVTAND